MEFFYLYNQLVEDSMIKLDRICREANVMLIFARSYGLTGLVRISTKVIYAFFFLELFYIGILQKVGAGTFVL